MADQKVFVLNAPTHGTLRLDVDAAFRDNLNSYAIGGIIRNLDGQPILAFGRKIEKPLSVMFAELCAGLKISEAHSIKLQHITSDSLLAVQAVMTEEENFSYAGALATDIRRLLASPGSPTLTHVRRSANNVAHSIADFSISSTSPFVWEREIFFFWLINLVIKDISLF
ncbi:uncharacterized protein [Henckelia pumila]|uniref:uncharacterized protein n=1 Tax=Henckelia pumila TaxID=405737 RepID=UPI003C6E8CB1